MGKGANARVPCLKAFIDLINESPLAQHYFQLKNCLKTEQFAEASRILALYEYSSDKWKLQMLQGVCIDHLPQISKAVQEIHLAPTAEGDIVFEDLVDLIKTNRETSVDRYVHEGLGRYKAQTRELEHYNIADSKEVREENLENHLQAAANIAVKVYENTESIQDVGVLEYKEGKLYLTDKQKELFAPFMQEVFGEYYAVYKSFPRIVFERFGNNIENYPAFAQDHFLGLAKTAEFFTTLCGSDESLGEIIAGTSEQVMLTEQYREAFQEFNEWYSTLNSYQKKQFWAHQLGDAISSLPLDVGLAKGLSAGLLKTGVKVFPLHGGVIGVAKTGVGEIYKEFLRTPFMRAYLKAQFLLKEISPDSAGRIQRMVQLAKQRGVSLEEAIRSSSRSTIVSDKTLAGLRSEVSSTIVEGATTTPAREIVAEGTSQTRPKKLIAHDVVESTVAKTEANVFKGIKFHPEVVNVEILQEAEILFKDVPGANELIKTIEKCGHIDAIPGNLGTAKGAMFELEYGVELSKRGEDIVAFGRKLRGSTGRSEFDIVTPDTLFECKNRKWANISEKGLQEFKRQTNRAWKTAQEHEKNYCIIFKGKPSTEIKNWLNKKNITYMEI